MLFSKSGFEKISDYINAWNKEEEMEMGLFRISIPDFDRRAFRESLVNAYCHAVWKAFHNIETIQC